MQADSWPTIYLLEVVGAEYGRSLDFALVSLMFTPTIGKVHHGESFSSFLAFYPGFMTTYVCEKKERKKEKKKGIRFPFISPHWLNHGSNEQNNIPLSQERAIFKIEHSKEKELASF